MSWTTLWRITLAACGSRCRNTPIRRACVNQRCPIASFRSTSVRHLAMCWRIMCIEPCWRLTKEARQYVRHKLCRSSHTNSSTLRTLLTSRRCSWNYSSALRRLPNDSRDLAVGECFVYSRRSSLTGEVQRFRIVRIGRPCKSFDTSPEPDFRAG